MKKTEAGRSMIEMLGVLAIIGVLSIGGLAGYTMAMNRHRANTILDYASRCVVVAQTNGDGSSMDTGSCVDVLENEPVPGGATDAQLSGSVDQPVVTVTVTSDKVAEALVNRSGGTVEIAEGSADSTVTIKFNANLS